MEYKLGKFEAKADVSKVNRGGSQRLPRALAKCNRKIPLVRTSIDDP